MNIFILDLDPKTCAKYHCDKHVIKMVLESAQLLSTAHWVLNSDIKEQLYLPTHTKHPCSIWTSASLDNYKWLYNLFNELAKEYEFRYNKHHRTHFLLSDKLINPPSNIPDIGLTEFAQAMPDKYKDKDKDPVIAYRNYYIGEKYKIAKWCYPTQVPEWFK